MTTEGKTGLGDRHRYSHLASPKEQRERELAEAKRTIDKLTHRCEALESTLRTVNKLAEPYAKRPAMPMLRRVIEPRR